MPELNDKPASEDSQDVKPDGEDRPEGKRADNIDELSALLRGEDLTAKPDDQASGETAEGEDPPKDGKLDTLDAVAEKLGVDVSDLYKISIKQAPGPGGEDRAVTLGALADIAKDTGKLELDRMEFDETKSKREADLMRAQQELTEIVNLLPKSAVSPDLVRAVAKKMAATETREAALTLKAIPDWSDDKLETTERAAMTEHLAGYGYPANYLESIKDHRTVFYIRENWQRQRNMERALTAMKRTRADSLAAGKRAKPGDKPGLKAVASRGRRGTSEKIDAVAKLLKG